MVFTVHDRVFTSLLGSDVERDGMYIEVTSQEDNNAVLEVFYSDVTHRMEISLFREKFPVELVEWAILQAKTRLPPTQNPKDN